MANLRYYLGPWLWVSDDTESYWSAPDGTVGLVDLRGLPDQGIQTLGDKPFGFFCVSPTVTLPSEYTLLGTGDCRDLNATTQNRNAWLSLLGYRPSGVKLVDLLWDQLTQGSDPDGDVPTPPLMPTTRGHLDLLLGGHSVVKRESYSHGKHPHTGKVEDVLKRQFRLHFGKGEKRESDHARKVLDYWLDKYRLSKSDWQRLVPADLRRHIPGPLKHETTLTDNFNRTDENPILSPWTQIQGTYRVSANQARSSGASRNRIRYESDLSGDDHCSRIAVGATGATVLVAMVRKDSSATLTYYSYEGSIGAGHLLAKYIGDTRTNLATGGALAMSVGHTVCCEADGSSITGYYNGTSATLGPITDTAITGNTRVGIGVFGANQYGDDFFAEDLGAPPSSVSATFGAALDWTTGLAKTGQAPEDWLGGVSDSEPLPADWFGNLTLALEAPVDFVGSLARSDQPALDWVGSIATTEQLAADWLGGVSDSELIPTDWTGLAVVTITPIFPIDWSASLDLANAGAIDWTTGISPTRQTPLDWLATASPVEVFSIDWTGSSEIRYVRIEAEPSVRYFESEAARRYFESEVSN